MQERRPNQPAAAGSADGWFGTAGDGEPGDPGEPMAVPTAGFPAADGEESPGPATGSWFETPAAPEREPAGADAGVDPARTAAFANAPGTSWFETGPGAGSAAAAGHAAAFASAADSAVTAHPSAAAAAGDPAFATIPEQRAATTDHTGAAHRPAAGADAPLDGQQSPAAAGTADSTDPAEHAPGTVTAADTPAEPSGPGRSRPRASAARGSRRLPQDPATRSRRGVAPAAAASRRQPLRIPFLSAAPLAVQTTPAQTTVALAAVWLGVLLAHLLGLDLLVLAAIVLGTAALSRYGSTLLDRLMAAVVLLAGAGIVGGLVISYWPWGLDPVAVGGAALTALLGVRVLTGRALRLPLRVPAVDAVALGSGAAAVMVAAWPTLHTDYWKRFMYSVLLADRVRQFAMFDVVRAGHSYAFAHFDRVSAMALPGARSYPSGMQMVYSIVDSFAHGDGSPGDPLAEFDRYYWYTLLSFGLLVLAVVWAARRIAGPLALGSHRLPAVFVCAGIGGFLASGYFLSYVWQGFDSVVFASVFLIAGMAVALRPPQGVLEHALLAGSAFLAVVYGHPLLLPHISLVLVASLVLYRKRVLKVLKKGRFGLVGSSSGLAAAGVALVAVPLLALSGLSIGTRFRTDGFIIALPRHLVVTVAVLALAALANPAARRLPTARAALLAIAAAGLVQLGMLIGFSDGSTHYYVEKSLNSFVLMALVGTGGLIALWPRRGPAAQRGQPWLVRRAEAFTATVLTAALAVAGVGALPFAPAYLNWSRYQPGTDDTWAQLWTGGHTFIADYGHQLRAQEQAGVYTSGRAVIVASSPAGVLNLNMSLFAGAMNRDLHSVGGQVNNAAQLTGLVGLPSRGPWPAQAQAGLKVLEHIVTSNPAPVLVIVSDKTLAAKLANFAAANPDHHFDVEYVP